MMLKSLKEQKDIFNRELASKAELKTSLNVLSKALEQATAQCRSHTDERFARMLESLTNLDQHQRSSLD